VETNAEELLALTVGDGVTLDQSDYFIFHVLRWKDLESGKSEQAIDKQNWYVFHKGKWSQEDFTTRKRLMGTKKLWMVYIHLNRDSLFQYQAEYKVEVASKTPAYLNNLFQVAGLFQPTSLDKSNQKSSRDFWGAKSIPVDYRPSDITVTPTITFSNDSLCSALKPSVAKGLKSEKFDNEGKYFLDFSIGVPLRKVSELSLSETGNTVTAKKVDTTRAFALLNLFYPAVDIKSRNFGLIPHLVTGVGIGSKPFQNIFLGAGWGPYFANFYAGILWKTQRLPDGTKCGVNSASSSNGQSNNKTCAQFTFGLNLPVGGVIESLKKTKAGK